MALALYRKYRPRTFGELIGQDHVTEPLSQALRSGRLNHAYLFSGPRGCGKTSSARILARSLNCEQGPTPEPCGECDSCQSLRTDGPGSVDVIEIDAASHGGVDDARELRERAFFTPVAGRYKIYVIDEAHMVSSAGFNALLKLVEEPPEYVKFVFATTEPEKVLPTIKSRTHHYPFRLVPPSLMRPFLEQMCTAEGVSVEPTVFPLVVRAGGGSVRDTLSVLDQLIAGAGAEGVTYPRAAALLGVTDAALIDELCDALAARDGAAIFAAVDRVAEAGHDARRFAADLLERFRDLMILQQVPDAAASGLLDVPTDQLDRMSVHAHQLGLATLSRCADIVHNGLVEMRGTASPRLLLELICARMLLPGADDGAAALLQRLESVEQRLTAGPPAAPPATPPAASPPATAPVSESPFPASPPPAAPAAAQPPGAPPADAAPVSGPTAPVASAPPVSGPTAPVASAPPAGAPPAGAPPAGAPPAGGPTAPVAGAVDAATVRRVWEEIVATVSRQSKRAAAVVREASVRDVEGDTVVLHFQHAVHANMLTSSPQPLVAALGQVLGGAWQVRCESGGGPADGGRRQPPARPDPPPPAGPATPPPGPDAPRPAGPGAPPADLAAPPTAGTAGAAATSTPSGAAGYDEEEWPELAQPPNSGPSMAAPAPPADGPAGAERARGAGGGPAPPVRSQPGGAPKLAAATSDGMDPTDLAQLRAESTSVGSADRGGGAADDRAFRLLEQTLGAERVTGAAP
ncbi:DNA polymerase III subunit gamma and tau [Natronosporangium hydrolyticum]|uniref:DNA polymerase III subunit gamma/tau n=1 Tax=Natronosporangium hydrolyticum TaxID=2811111 RepID=A0A895YFU9_9ACTN|nr:DNA polymerase III subunit gamma and tau [Natronosporangium hydrolyticum]QSB14982.1 DNA polymerase III subunit gamma and tau [Natronosporangium hydrolyticum]